MNASRPVLIVVDDEPEVLRSIHDLFRMEYRVRTFTDPNEALGAFEDQEVPVVMSDQRMPSMSGVEFLRRVKQRSPDTTRLLFTGYSDIKAVIDAINEGNVFRYISKPWDHEELASIIRQAVDLHDLIVSKRQILAELRETNARLHEANRVKSVFIEVASHELNTPVAVVLGLTDLWKLSQAAEATPAERTWVDRIQVAGRRLAGIVERMLKLLQSDQFAHTLDLRVTEIEPLVRRVVADAQPFLQARRQEVAIEIDPATGSAEIDPAKIGDVLANLLVNAIKFTPDGQSIRISAAPQADDWIHIQVSDPGVGIQPEERTHLFQPFFTCFDTLHHSSGEFQYLKRGIGLGLHLVKTFVELHGGRLDEVASEPNRGSTFGFLLPRRQPSLPAPAHGL